MINVKGIQTLAPIVPNGLFKLDLSRGSFELGSRHSRLVPDSQRTAFATLDKVRHV